MPWLNVVLLVYAVFNLAMGFLGFAGLVTGHSSKISLIAGTIAAVLIAGSIVLTKANPRAGRIMAFVVAILLLGKWAPGTFHNQLYPDGINFLAALIVTICLGTGHMMGMKAKREREATGTNVHR